MLLLPFLVSIVFGLLVGAQNHAAASLWLGLGLGLSGALAAIGHTAVELRLLNRWLIFDRDGGYYPGEPRSWLDTTAIAPFGFVLAVALSSLWPTNGDGWAVVGTIFDALLTTLAFLAGFVVVKLVLGPFIEDRRMRRLTESHG